MSNRAISTMLLVGLIFLATNSYADEIILSVNTKKPIAVATERFLSLTIDPTTLVRGDFLTTDFERSTKIVKALAPAYLRFGGPESNFYVSATYSQHDQADPDNPFTEEHWMALQRWSERSGLDVISCIPPQYLNAGAFERAKNSEKIFDLISFSDRMQYNTSWQIGYECQTRCDLSAAELGKYVTQLRNKLDSFPRYSRSIIVGPDVVAYRSRQQQLYLQDYLTAAYPALSALTWHPNFAGVTVSKNRVTIHQDNLAADKEELYKVINQAAGRRPLWLAESKSEECKDQFLGALLWTRRLGNAAKIGAQVLMRNPTNPSEATPDYWVSLLHKTLVGREVLEVRTQAGNSSHVYFYGQCTKPSEMYEKGALTVFAVNLTPAKVTASLKGTKVKSLHEYILQPGFDKYNRMFAKTVLLNSKPLRLTKDGDLPNLVPLIKTGTKGADFELPSGGIGFWVLPDAKIKSCTDHEDQSTEKVLRRASKQLEEHVKVGNVQGLDDVMERGRRSEVTDERRRQKRKYSKHDEEDYEEKKAKKSDLQKYIDLLWRFLKRKLGSHEGRKPLVLNGTYTLFDPNREAMENVELNKKGRFEEIKAVLEEYKSDFSLTDSATDLKTTTQALELISKIENGMETLEREIDTITRVGNPKERELTSEKLENINTQIRRHLEQLHRLLPEEQNRKKILNNKYVSYNSSEFQAGPLKDTVKRTKRDVDGKFVEDFQSFRRNNTVKKRVRTEDAKDRRNDRQNRRKNVVRRDNVTPYYDSLRSDSNENNFHGFWRQEPLKSFPQGDIYLATGESSEESNKDYEYVQDEEVTQDNRKNAKVRTLVVDYTEPDDTWVGNGSDHLGYVPNEFYEVVNIPNVHKKVNLNDYSELWEAESLQKFQGSEQPPKEDVREIKITPEKRPVEKEDNQTRQKTAERSRRYYEDVRDREDDDVLQEESVSDSGQVESEEISPRVSNRNTPMYVTGKSRRGETQTPTIRNGRIVQSTPKKVRSLLSNGDDELIDLNSMHFRRELAPSRDTQVYDRVYNRRPKRKIDNVDDIFHEEMVAQDDNNLKDCKCRVNRCNRLKRNSADIQVNEETVSEQEEKLQIENSTTTRKTEYESSEPSSEIHETTESMLMTSVVEDSDKKDLVTESKLDAKVKREPRKDEIDEKIIQEPAGKKLQGATTTTKIPEEHSTVLSDLGHEISSETEVSTQNTLEEESGEFFRENVGRVKGQIPPVNITYHHKDNSENRKDAESSLVENSISSKTETFAETPGIKKSAGFGEETKAAVKKRHSSVEVSVTNSSAEVETDVKSSKEEVELKEEPPAKEKPEQQTSKPAKRFTDTKSPPTTSRNTANRRLNSKSANSSTKSVTRLSQRAEEIAKIIESRLAARAEALAALKRENERKARRQASTKNASNDNTRLQESQKRRLDLINKLKEKLAARREKMLQTYRNELQRALEKASDEGKRSVKRREVWEKLRESDDYKDMVDGERLAYILTYKPVDYRGADRRVESDVADKKYIPVTEITKPLHEVREKIVNSKRSPHVSYDPSVMSYSNYDVLDSVKYPSIDEIVQSRDELRNSERGSGKVYYSIVENLDEPRIFEYQPKANHMQEENIGSSESDKARAHASYDAKGYAYSKSERSVKPNTSVRQYRNSRQLIKPDQNTQIPLQDQQLFHITPTLLERSKKESGYRESGYSTSNDQEGQQYQVVYRLNKIQQKPHVPVTKQDVKIPTQVPKTSEDDRTDDKFKSLFSPEERFQIIRLLTDVENEPHIPKVQQSNVEDLSRITGEKEYVPRVLESFFTPEELEKYQINQSPNTPIVRSQNNKRTTRNMDRRHVVYSLPVSITSSEDLDSNSDEDSEEYLQTDGSTGRRVYVLDPSTYHGGDPVLELHEDETEDTSTDQENSEPGNLYRIVSNKPYKFREQPSAKLKLGVQEFPITAELPNADSSKQIIRTSTNEKEKDEVQRNEPVVYILDATDSNKEAQKVTITSHQRVLGTDGRRDTQSVNKSYQTDVSVEDIPENGLESQSLNDDAEADYNNHQPTDEKKVIIDDGVFNHTKNVSVRDAVDDYAEKEKRISTSKSEVVEVEREEVDAVEQEAENLESYSPQQHNGTKISTTRKKRELRSAVKDDSIEWMYPMIQAQNINQLGRNAKSVNSRSTGFNDNLSGYSHKKGAIFHLVQPDEYHKALPLEVGNINDRAGINKQNIGKRVIPMHLDFLSPNSKYQPSCNTLVNTGDTTAQGIVEILVPRELDDDSASANIEIENPSSESEEYNSDSGSCEESSSSEDSMDQQAVLINISDEDENADDFETVLEDAARNRYRGKKLTENEYPHLYDILKANNGNRQGMMMLLPLERSKLSRQRRQVMVGSSESGKSQILSEAHSISIEEDAKDVTASLFVEEDNTQTAEDDDENIWETITNLRKEDQNMLSKYVIEKNRILKEFEEMRRNKKYTLGSQQPEEFNPNIVHDIKTIKYIVPSESIESSLANVNENFIDVSFKDFENDQHTQGGYEKIEGLSTYIENGIPKVENAIETGLEKVKNLTGSVEHFIEDFDDKFNETLTPNERIKLRQNESASSPTESVLNTAIINVKKLFRFFSGIMQLLHA